MYILFLLLSNIVHARYICSVDNKDWYTDYSNTPIQWNRVVGVNQYEIKKYSLCQSPMFIIPPYSVWIQSVCLESKLKHLYPFLYTKSTTFTLSNKINILDYFYMFTNQPGIYQAIVNYPIRHMYTICLYKSIDSSFSKNLHYSYI
jgi:hypothetical protein